MQLKSLKIHQGPTSPDVLVFTVGAITHLRRGFRPTSTSTSACLAHLGKSRWERLANFKLISVLREHQHCRVYAMHVASYDDDEEDDKDDGDDDYGNDANHVERVRDL